MSENSKNFMNDSLNESNFDLTSSLQDHFDRVENMDLISDTSSVRTSNSFSRMGMEMVPGTGGGLSPRSSQKKFFFNQKKAKFSGMRSSWDFKKNKQILENQFYEGCEFISFEFVKLNFIYSSFVFFLKKTLKYCFEKVVDLRFLRTPETAKQFL